MTALRLTRDGKGALALCVGLSIIALQTGNNLVYMVAAVLWSALILAPIFAAWNLRGLRVRRALPDELFATAEARGAFVIENTRHWLSAVAIRIEDLDHPAALAQVAAIDPGSEEYVPTGWSFPNRGAQRLSDIRLSSSFPFGLVECSRDLERPATLVIFPRPRPGLWTTEAGYLGSDAGRGQSVGAFGDFSTLREYLPGDSIRSIHWPTSARSGQPIVVVRTGEGARQVVIRVADKVGPSWEVEISKATGQLMRAFQQGCAVGLQLPDKHFEVRNGGSWRRDLLETLAKLESRA